MDVLLASDRLSKTVSLLTTVCNFSMFRLHLIVNTYSIKHRPHCIASIRTRSQIENELFMQNPSWVAPWSDTTASKHDTFYNLVRFYAVNLTQLKHANTFVLLDDDIRMSSDTTALRRFLNRLLNQTAYAHLTTKALTADCESWDTVHASPRKIKLIDTDMFSTSWRKWLYFLDKWQYRNDPLDELWWNFGFVVINRTEWMKAHLSFIFEEAVRLYTRLAYSRDSIDYGLVLAQIAFSGKVACLPSNLISSGLGFSENARVHANAINAPLLHYNGHVKPWHTIRRALNNDEYNTCKNDHWKQCGGKHFAGKRCCALGWTCKKINDYYSQCVPSREGPCANPFWSQCDGYQFRGQKCCRLGSKCIEYNKWYSQCIPD